MSKKTKTNREKQEVEYVGLDLTITATVIDYGGRSRSGTIQTILQIAGGTPFTRHLGGNGVSGWTGSIPDPRYCDAETKMAIAEALRRVIRTPRLRKAHEHGDRVVFICRYERPPLYPAA